MIKSEETVGFLWNEDIRNYCLAKNKKEFVFPLEELKLKEIKDDKSLMETLQMIYYKRFGKINHQIGANKDYNIKLAKELNVW